MKNPSSLLALCLLAASSACAASSAPASGWDNGAPVLQSQVPARPPSGGGVAGQFDSYNFTMSWEPAFCEGKGSLPECSSQSADRFDATHLSLHGLWPDKNGDTTHSYGYCGVSPRDQSNDRGPTWCQLPDPGLSAATRDALLVVMPGASSCLDHHEWTKHGTCSGMTGDAYFSAAVALVQKIAGTNFGKFLAAHAGQTIQGADAFAAFESDFGAGSRGAVSFKCTNVRGGQGLLEVHMHLANPLRPAAELKSMLISTGDAGNCPASFLLDAIPGR